MRPESGIDLTLGVVTDGSISGEILFELLDHQGISYREVDGMAKPATYPVVLLSRYSDRMHAMALKACKEEQNVLVAGRVVALEEVESRFRGRSVAEDNFELVVNKEEERLASAIRNAYFAAGLPFVRKWFWPQMSAAGCVLSHDVDWFEYSPFHKGVLKQSINPARISRMSYNRLLKGRDYGWNIPEIVELERSYGYNSTFFFQAAYGRNDPFLSQSAEILKAESFEIALHGARTSHKNPDSLSDELDQLSKKTGHRPRGVRNHILKFEVPRTWEIQASEGLQYDATFYFNRFFGFRAGICFPYHPISDSRLPILELPTSYMDWTSLHRGQGSKEQLETLERTSKKVEEFHGVLVVNFHNTYLNETTFPTVYRSYTWLLDEVKARGYWVATAEACARWWNFRASARIDPMMLESGEVRCSPSGVDVIVEREGREPETMGSAPRDSAMEGLGGTQ